MSCETRFFWRHRGLSVAVLCARGLFGLGSFTVKCYTAGLVCIFHSMLELVDTDTTDLLSADDALAASGGTTFHHQYMDALGWDIGVCQILAAYMKRRSIKPASKDIHNIRHSSTMTEHFWC
jgi:hypothetical protein